MPNGIKRNSHEPSKVAKAPAPPAVKPSTQPNTFQEFVASEDQRFNDCKSPTEASVYTAYSSNFWGTEYDPPLTDDEGYRNIESALGEAAPATYLNIQEALPEDRKERREFPPDVDLSKISDGTPPVVARPKSEVGSSTKATPSEAGLQKPVSRFNLPYLKTEKKENDSSCSKVPKSQSLQNGHKESLAAQSLPKPPQVTTQKIQQAPPMQAVKPEPHVGSVPARPTDDHWAAFDDSPDDSPDETRNFMVNIRTSMSPTRDLMRSSTAAPAVIPKLPPPEKKKEVTRAPSTSAVTDLSVVVFPTPPVFAAPVTALSPSAPASLTSMMISPPANENLFAPQFGGASLPATPQPFLIPLASSCPAPSSQPLIPAPRTPDQESQDLENRLESYLAAKHRTKTLEERTKREQQAARRREEALKALQAQKIATKKQFLAQMVQPTVQSESLPTPPKSNGTVNGFEDSFSSLQLDKEPTQEPQDHLKHSQQLQNQQQQQQKQPQAQSSGALRAEIQMRALASEFNSSVKTQSPSVAAAKPTSANLGDALLLCKPTSIQNNKSLLQAALAKTNGHQPEATVAVPNAGFATSTAVGGKPVLNSQKSHAKTSLPIGASANRPLPPSSVPLVPTPVSVVADGSSQGLGAFSGSLGDLLASTSKSNTITLEDLAKGSKPFGQLMNFGNNLSRSQETLNKPMPQQTAFVLPLKSASSTCNPRLTAGPSGQNVNIFCNQQPLVPTPVNVNSQRKTIRSFDELNNGAVSLMGIGNPTAEVKPFMVRPPPPPPRQPELENLKTSPTHVQPSNTEILAMQTLLPGSSREECLAAIMANPGNIEGALRQIKLDHLVRLGIASRQVCENALRNHQWNVDQAASALLDSR